MDHGILFLLGADDPEMREIERVLAWDKRNIQYAMKDGRRVHPGNAYQAEAIEGEWQRVVLIECQPASLPHDAETIRIDHHRPGDPGYGLPPSQFWQASSIGQLCEFMGVSQEVASQDNLILAAMDHCPAAAIRGECPGVSAQEVLERKVAEIATATKRVPKEVLALIGEYQSRLMDAQPVWIGGEAISDMRDYDLGEGYSLDYLCAQVAALEGGYTVLLLAHDRGDVRPKWTVSGHASPMLIERFKEEWAPAQGLTGIYGVPERGYAGGYLS